MSNLALAAPKAGIIRIPEERVLAMIASCAEQIERATTIADAREVTDVAEAIAAVARKIKVAKDVKHAAVRILIEAEAKLGEITAAIPHARCGGGKKKVGFRKADVLRENGISRARANFAERLATTPQKKIEEVVAAGASTMHAVLAKLDLQTSNYSLREKRTSAIAFLCEEAVSLLERSVKASQVPHAGTVADMVRRFRTLTQHGNAKDMWPRTNQ